MWRIVTLTDTIRHNSVAGVWEMATTSGCLDDGHHTGGSVHLDQRTIGQRPGQVAVSINHSTQPSRPAPVVALTSKVTA